MHNKPEAAVLQYVGGGGVCRFHKIHFQLLSIGQYIIEKIRKVRDQKPQKINNLKTRVRTKSAHPFATPFFTERHVHV